MWWMFSLDQEGLVFSLLSTFSSRKLLTDINSCHSLYTKDCSFYLCLFHEFQRMPATAGLSMVNFIMPSTLKSVTDGKNNVSVITGERVINDCRRDMSECLLSTQNYE